MHSTLNAAAPEPGQLQLRLPFVPPYDWDSMLAFLGARAIPGVEHSEPGVYRRSIEIASGTAGVEIRRVADDDCLQLRIVAAPPLDLLRIAEGVRRLFDLACNPRQIAEHFQSDTRLGALVRRHPGLRVPGAWDPFELAIRTILGQQVSVTAASTLAGRLVMRFGTTTSLDLPGITHGFPSPAQLADADVRQIGIPEARAQTIRRLARAVADETLVLDGSRDLDATVAALSAIKGVGPWTVQYIAMRALGDLDSLPAGDLGVKKALAGSGARPGDADVVRIAAAWRPFRAYAVMYLWRSLG